MDLKEKSDVEQIWIDFGKQHTGIQVYDPDDIV